ncbi:MAG: hypothetical protein J2P15_19965 [Micromonosporaceae bacterium]|nr:hypothetical protein [Micromonosporaceae bacterium]
MSAWDDYATAAQRLDEVRQEAASIVSSQAAALDGALGELAALRPRLAVQRARLSTVDAPRLPGPPLAPEATPTDPAGAAALLRESADRVRAVDAILSTVEADQSRRRPVRRNALLYLGFAVLMALPALVALPLVRRSVLLVPVVGCAAFFPILGYGLAWLLADRRNRTPVLGAVVSIAAVLAIYLIYLTLLLAGAL